MTATVTVPIGSVASTSSPRIDTAHGSAAPGVPWTRGWGVFCVPDQNAVAMQKRKAHVHQVLPDCARHNDITFSSCTRIGFLTRVRVCVCFNKI